LLKTLAEGFPHLKHTVARLTLQKYQISIEDVPSWEDGADNEAYGAKLCRDFLRFGVGEVHTLESLLPESLSADAPDLKRSESTDNEESIVALHRCKGTNVPEDEGVLNLVCFSGSFAYALTDKTFTMGRETFPKKPCQR
jgi:hypothetical protein